MIFAIVSLYIEEPFSVLFLKQFHSYIYYLGKLWNGNCDSYKNSNKVCQINFVVNSNSECGK